MFSSSVRRAALTTPPAPIVSSLSTAAPRAAASQTLSYQCHQRRYSSSKPSSPADGSKGSAEAVPAAPSQARPDGEKKSSRASKRKAKDDDPSSSMKGRHESMQNLPSVPSTQHISANRKLWRTSNYRLKDSNNWFLQTSAHPLSSPSTALFPSPTASPKP